MKKFFAPRHLFAFAILGLVVLVAACGSNTPTSTPVPPTSNAPTALPPAPTAPPLTDAPTPIPPTAAPTAVLPTQPPAPTAVLPTNAPTAVPPAPTNTTASSTGVATAIRPATKPASTGATGSTVDRGPLNGLFITALRFDPTYPVKNTPIMFYATLINNTGKDQNYPICAEIFRPGAGKSFGITNCDTTTIVPGTSEVYIGNWIATGIKECIPVRARAVLHELDTDNVRLVVPTTRGAELWTDFQMCP